MNSGTAEQEQNGVTTPSPAASTLPTPRRRPESSARVRSGDTKVWITPMTNTMSTSSRMTFGDSKTKKPNAEPRCVSGPTPTSRTTAPENPARWV